MTKKIVVLEPLGIKEDYVVESLNKVSENYEVIYYGNRVEDEKNLIKRSKEASILVVSNIKLSEKVLKNCPNLEMICVAFTGVDHIDVDYCHKNNILVSNASGYATEGVVELTFGLIFDLYRKITLGNKIIRENGTHHSLLGNEISGKKFGIVGAGEIGSGVAKIADTFNADVYVFNRRKVNIENATQVGIEEIFKTSDIISIHLPLNAETKGMINSNLLSLMKEDAIIINTARGPVIDNDYLAEMLIENKIAGAGIDVFDYEPPIKKDYKLLKAPNIILTPHVAYYTQEAMEKRFTIVVENIKAYLNNDPINVIK